MMEILFFKDVAKLLKKDPKPIKRYTRLPKNPLPIHRLKNARPYFIFNELSRWIESNLLEE
jgi:hypothetical protein